MADLSLDEARRAYERAEREVTWQRFRAETGALAQANADAIAELLEDAEAWLADRPVFS